MASENLNLELFSFGLIILNFGVLQWPRSGCPQSSECVPGHEEDIWGAVVEAVQRDIF